MLEGILSDYNAVADTGNEALMAQKMRLDQRRAELAAEAKAARSALESPPQGQMVSGIYVKPSKLQAFMPAIQQVVTGLQTRALDQRATELDQRVAAAARQHWQSAPPDDAPTQVKLRWAEAGQRIPGLAPIMDKFAQDTLIAAPERQAQRDFRKEESAANRAAREEQQARELATRKELNANNIADRQQRAQESNDLRTTLAAAVRAHGGGGGGDKASNYQIMTGDDGTLTRVNKLTGATEVLPGKGGKSQASLVKDQLDERDKKSNASKAIQDLDHAEKLLPLATGSKVGSIRDSIYGALGQATDGAKAAAELEPIANAIVANIPRMAGQVSDADLVFLKKQGGDLANKELPVDTRLAALKQVRRIMQRSAAGNAAPAAPAGPSIRQAVEAAAQPSSDEALLNKYLKK